MQYFVAQKKYCFITWSLANKGKRHNNEGEFMNISALSLYLPIVVTVVQSVQQLYGCKKKFPHLPVIP
jgi:hypothetical protein